MTLPHFLYAWLVTVGTIDTFLVAPALGKAATKQIVGRLFSTLAVLAGLVLCSYGRLLLIPPLPPLVVVGLFLVNIGLTGYAFTLPDSNIVAVARRSWRNR